MFISSLMCWSFVSYSISAHNAAAQHRMSLSQSHQLCPAGQKSLSWFWPPGHSCDCSVLHALQTATCWFKCGGYHDSSAAGQATCSTPLAMFCTHSTAHPEPATCTSLCLTLQPCTTWVSR
jgi:hypothetical protein